MSINTDNLKKILLELNRELRKLNDGTSVVVFNEHSNTIHFNRKIVVKSFNIHSMDYESIKL